MEANVYEKPQTLTHKAEHNLTILSDVTGILVLDGVLCARAPWAEVRLTGQGLANRHLLEIQNAWVVLNDADAAQVRYHLDTYAPKATK